MAITPTKQRVPIDMALLEILNHRIENRADDPETLTEGHIWLNTTEHKTKRVENGVVVPFFSTADAEKLASFETAIEEAQAAADAAAAILDQITSDDILSKYEKPSIKQEYDTIVAERTSYDATATLYGITTEKTAYDNAIIALSAYMTGLDPEYTDFTQDTPINGTLLKSLFSTCYSTKLLLSQAIYTYLQVNLASAISVADNAKTTADQAAIDAANALEIIEGVSNDSILAIQEKPAIVQQYNILITEQSGIDDEADEYSITTEKAAYDNAVIDLTEYLEALDPAYDDYTHSTDIIRVDFNNAFELVYAARQTLFNAIYEAAKLLADDASILAASKKRHFVAEPTTPYEVGDLWSNGSDLYRCIVERLTGAFNAADWEVATNYDRTKTIIDNGLVTTGRIEVGGGALGATNAGMNGSVSGTPDTDIRFWSGETYANRATAPFRVQNDGKLFATMGEVGGWKIDSQAIYRGTKKITDGFAANAGDITLAADGSVHAKNFYINVDGTCAYKGKVNDLLSKTIDIGNWDMDATDGVNVAHGIADYTKIRTISVIILPDSGGILPVRYLLTSAGTVGYDWADVNLARTTGGLFDGVVFDEVPLNRGYIVIQYLE